MNTLTVEDLNGVINFAYIVSFILVNAYFIKKKRWENVLQWNVLWILSLLLAVVTN